MSKRIAVMGAGIAGLATAIGLQRRGHEVTVVEQRTDTSSGAGISIWPNALAALGPIVVVGDAAHPMRPHLGQGGCQGLEDAAILATFVERAPDLPTAFARFVAFRRPRVAPLVRESAWFGKAVNVRLDFLGAAVSRATGLIPETLLMRHVATVAARSAFVPPTGGTQQ